MSKLKIDEAQIQKILENGNTAEVKKTKDGVIILEVKRKIRSNESDDVQSGKSSKK